jgi:hypothetical protein
MNNKVITIKIIEDAADVTVNPRTRIKLVDQLFKLFQEKGVVVSIDADESTGETRTDGEFNISQKENSNNR